MLRLGRLVAALPRARTAPLALGACILGGLAAGTAVVPSSVRCDGPTADGASVESSSGSTPRASRVAGMFDDAPEAAIAGGGASQSSEWQDEVDSSATGSVESVASEELSPPPDFEDNEYHRSMAVQEASGLMILLSPTVGRMENQRLSVTGQLYIDKAVNAMYTVSDERGKPTLSALVQPSQEGKVIKLSAGSKVESVPGLSVNGSVMVGWARLVGKEFGAKMRGPDFLAVASAKDSAAGKSWELAYQQRVLPQLSLGGSLSAQCDSFTPLPTPKALLPSVFGTWTSPGKEWTVLGRWAKESDSASVTVHRQVSRNTEVGAKLVANLDSLESSVALAGRVALGHDPFMGGPALTLTGNINSDLKVGVALQHQSVTPASNTQMISMLTVTADHKAREHSVGGMLQFFY